jgi:hypothetical protein
VGYAVAWLIADELQVGASSLLLSHVCAVGVCWRIAPDCEQQCGDGHQAQLLWVMHCVVVCCACCAVPTPLPPIVLCCAVLCCAVLCCAVLCCAVLCCAVLCCAVL